MQRINVGLRLAWMQEVAQRMEQLPSAT